MKKFTYISHRPHYVEYLCGLIRHHNLEPIDILTADDLETVVRRANKPRPPRPYGITEGIYRTFLLEVSPRVQHVIALIVCSFSFVFVYFFLCSFSNRFSQNSLC
jgi:E3 Ubiquitin Ligase RBR C-terminal domain